MVQSRRSSTNGACADIIKQVQNGSGKECLEGMIPAVRPSLLLGKYASRPSTRACIGEPQPLNVLSRSPSFKVSACASISQQCMLQCQDRTLLRSTVRLRFDLGELYRRTTLMSDHTKVAPSTKATPDATGRIHLCCARIAAGMLPSTPCTQFIDEAMMLLM